MDKRFKSGNLMLAITLIVVILSLSTVSLISVCNRSKMNYTTHSDKQVEIEHKFVLNTILEALENKVYSFRTTKENYNIISSTSTGVADIETGVLRAVEFDLVSTATEDILNDPTLQGLNTKYSVGLDTSYNSSLNSFNISVFDYINKVDLTNQKKLVKIPEFRVLINITVEGAKRKYIYGVTDTTLQIVSVNGEIGSSIVGCRVFSVEQVNTVGTTISQRISNTTLNSIEGGCAEEPESVRISSTLSDMRKDILRACIKYSNIPYVLSHDDNVKKEIPEYLDCSAYVYRVFEDVGLEINLDSCRMMPDRDYWMWIPISELLPGDILIQLNRISGHTMVYAGVKDDKHRVFEAQRQGVLSGLYTRESRPADWDYTEIQPLNILNNKFYAYRHRDVD